jgi:hypothetical protein
VFHLGNNAYGGHYICQSLINNVWYKINDDIITTCSPPKSSTSCYITLWKLNENNLQIVNNNMNIMANLENNSNINNDKNNNNNNNTNKNTNQSKPLAFYQSTNVSKTKTKNNVSKNNANNKNYEIHKQANFLNHGNIIKISNKKQKPDTNIPRLLIPIEYIDDDIASCNILETKYNKKKLKKKTLQTLKTHTKHQVKGKKEEKKENCQMILCLRKSHNQKKEKLFLKKEEMIKYKKKRIKILPEH